MSGFEGDSLNNLVTNSLFFNKDLKIQDVF